MHMKTKKRTLRITLWLLLYLTVANSVPAQEAELLQTIDKLSTALRSLTESSTDPCSICAKQMRKKAFKALNTELRPERIFHSSELCRFIRTTEFSGNELSLTCCPLISGQDTELERDPGSVELPWLTFRFHTAGHYLVGVAEKDFTDASQADTFYSLPPGTVFDGRVELVRYEYGDGPTYIYYRKSNHLEIHCRLLEVKTDSSRLLPPSFSKSLPKNGNN